MPIEWMQHKNIIEGFLRQGDLVILTAPPKTGKTAIASAMALAVAKGKRFAGKETAKGAVLWLALEESPAERAAVMRYARARRRTPFYSCYETIRPDTEDGKAMLWQLSLRLQPALIVVDPLYAAQSTRSNTQSLEVLKALAKRTGTAILVLHHLRDYQTRIEVQELSKYAQAVWSLDFNPTRHGRLVTLKCESRAEKPFVFRSKSPLHYSPMPEANPFSCSAVVLALLRQFATLSSRQIADLTGITHGAARNILVDLRRRGIVQISNKSGRTTYYRLGGAHRIEHPKKVKNPVCLPFKSKLFMQGIENEMDECDRSGRPRCNRCKLKTDA
jgi:hypothetical protein